MKRRHALRQAILLAFGMALGKLDVLKATSGKGHGELTVPLDQWHAVVFQRNGKEIVVSVDEIFEALAGGSQ